METSEASHGCAPCSTAVLQSPGPRTVKRTAVRAPVRVRTAVHMPVCWHTSGRALRHGRALPPPAQFCDFSTFIYCFFFIFWGGLLWGSLEDQLGLVQHLQTSLDQVRLDQLFGEFVEDCKYLRFNAMSSSLSLFNFMLFNWFVSLLYRCFVCSSMLILCIKFRSLIVICAS